MEPTAEKLAVEERAIHERVEKLEGELSALRARLEDISREREQLPRLRNLRTDIRISAALPAEKPEPVQALVIPAPAQDRHLDPLTWLSRSARGTGLFAPDPGADPKQRVALLFRTEPGRIIRLGANPDIEFRAGIFRLATADTVLVPVLVRVGPDEPENLYEAWANEYLSGLGSLMEALAVQERLAIFLYGDGCHLEQVFRVPNQLQDFAKEFLRVNASVRPLSLDAFHEARQAAYKRYPTVLSLWKGLKG
jgi:hypothetical protein